MNQSVKFVFMSMTMYSFFLSMYQALAHVKCVHVSMTLAIKNIKKDIDGKGQKRHNFFDFVSNTIYERSGKSKRQKYTYHTS